ncbi:MAG: RnfABCDGE type electron transport complex subunit D [Victivallales bacterium]|nr:RnfABCDGE type electron transport complex subunit D [Victivallales bacterium]
MAEQNTEVQGVRMPDLSRLVVSSSPHVHSDTSIRGIMLNVILALMPCAVASVYYFGWRALWIMLVTTASCVAVEAIANAMMKQRSTIGDCSAALTGLILAMNLPPTAPIWCCVVASIFAMGLGKMVYGGLGYNPFNPAMVGRLILLLGVPGIMNTFILPVKSVGVWATGAEAVTSATPLSMNWMECLAKGGAFSYADMFWGRIPGSLGETSFFAILIGCIYLIVRRIIRWQVPVCYIGTVALITGIAHAVSPNDPRFAPLTMHIMTGGLAFAAVFMATDMVTTPVNRTGSVIFAVGCGVITAVVRLWGSYPEGVTYSILLMNALTPLIDRLTAGKPFGMRTAAKEVRKA